MPYIDRCKLLKDLCTTAAPTPSERWIIEKCIAIVNEQPSADVVSKSEIVNILDGLMKEAREIAGRYEKSVNETSYYDYARFEYKGCQMGALLVLFKIAELKKKYTEGEDV